MKIKTKLKEGDEVIYKYSSTFCGSHSVTSSNCKAIGVIKSIEIVPRGFLGIKYYDTYYNMVVPQRRIAGCPYRAKESSILGKIYYGSIYDV